MTIKKLKNGSYSVNVFYPKEVRQILGITTERYRKNFPTKAEAIHAENDLNRKIKKVLQEKNARPFELKAKMTFKEFYKKVWWDMYLTGSTGRTRQIPTSQTVSNTKDLFRLHILPMFGDYTLLELNSNKKFVLTELNKKGAEYANIKTIKSYVNQVFEIAELLDYIEYNRVAKIMTYVGDTKKQQLKMQRQQNGASLSAKELKAWITAFKTDVNNGHLPFKDYVLFMLTLHLGDRKSQSYALQWKLVDLQNGTIYLKQNKDKKGNIVPTKGKKNTLFKLPIILIELLSKWKKIQAQELLQIGVKQNSEQFLFTYTDSKGNVNQLVHIDYLNYRLKSVERRHPELTHATPHKLRHTFSTLAYEGGASMEEISRALTHSDTKTTQTYVNAPRVVDLSTYEKFEQRLNDVQ